MSETLGFGVACAAALLAGCVSTEMYMAIEELERASNAVSAYRYEEAERRYTTALGRLQLAGADGAEVSGARYNLARVKGFLCKFDDAERLFAESLAYERRVGANGARLTRRLIEMARLHYDRGEYAKAAPLFADGLDAIRAVSAESAELLRFADALDDYAHALRASGSQPKADAIDAESARIRAAHVGPAERDLPQRYSYACAQHAQQRDDWKTAAELLRILVLNSSRGHLPAARVAWYEYELGRSAGATCDFAEAERAFEASLKLDRATGGRTFMVMAELALLYKHQRRLDVAAESFERFFSEIDSHSEVPEPNGTLAALLEAHAEVLLELGRADAARTQQERAGDVRAASMRPATRFTPYGQHCAS
jgi:tetratricopeptide (TPR) repeat protein